MIHVFVLILYLGQKQVSQAMFFRSIDDCKYYAQRLNNQPPVPNRRAGEDIPKTISYTAVCEIKKVDPKKTLVYK